MLNIILDIDENKNCVALKQIVVNTSVHLNSVYLIQFLQALDLIKLIYNSDVEVYRFSII